jgi:hypothetical protein
MAKKLVKKIKVQAKGGKATPAPPLGPVLGQAGINIGEFVNQFNEQTRDRMGEVVPVEGFATGFSIFNICGIFHIEQSAHFLFFDHTGDSDGTKRCNLGTSEWASRGGLLQEGR